MTKAKVAIDLNVRCRGNGTVSGFEDVEGILMVGDCVTVHELESGIEGHGRVTEIDNARQLVYLAVDWSGLTARTP